MKKIRGIERIWSCSPTLEGAGVRLCRAFGYNEARTLDPFLLLDDFHSENPRDYVNGFPWHPHRGIETVTYMISGSVEHGDSLGNSGRINSGDVQWMTAGSGIIHQEMPQPYDGMFQGFQLWVNLPRAHKMMAPRYREVKAGELAVVDAGGGVTVRIIAGEMGGKMGPVRDLVVECEYFDVEMRAGAAFELPVRDGNNAIAYIYAGEARVGAGEDVAGARSLVHFKDMGDMRIVASGKGARALVAAGRPLREPIAWRGPIVMNTEEELATAFEEYMNGTFIRQEGRCTEIGSKEGCRYYKK